MGLSQGALAEKLGVSVNSIGLWESGKTKPRREARERLQALFGQEFFSEPIEDHAPNKLINADDLHGEPTIPVLLNVAQPGQAGVYGTDLSSGALEALDRIARQLGRLIASIDKAAELECRVRLAEQSIDRLERRLPTRGDNSHA